MNIKIVVPFLLGFVIAVIGRYFEFGFIIFLGLIVMFSPAILHLATIKTQIKNNEEKTMEKINNKLTELKYTHDKLLMANDLETAIGFSKESKNVLLLSRNNLNEEFRHNIVDFEDFIEVRIKRNSETLTTTSRGSQLVGAAVGGLTFGGIGSLIGAMGASSKASPLTKRLSLELVINDLDSPLFEVVFINMEKGLSESDELFKSLTKDLDYWYRVFTVILHQNKLNIASS